MPEPLEFYKMSGAGNDFIVGDNRGGAWSILDLPALARGLCRRGLGVGADGLVLVEGSMRGRFRIRVFNNDGNETLFCGNGTRCAVRYAFLKVISGRQTTVETAVGVLEAEVCPDSEVRVRIPLRGGAPRPITLDVGNKPVQGFLVQPGVPHFVVFVNDVERTPVSSLGASLRSHRDLGEGGANVDFLQLVGETGPHRIRTYERGIEGETLACGTGVTAAAWLLCRTFSRPSFQRFQVRSGRILEVEVPPESARDEWVRLKGEAAFVFRGYLTEEALGEALRC